MLRKTYSPEPLDTDVCSTEVSTLGRTMVAPGITAPLGSRITPFTEAVETWALAVARKEQEKNTQETGCAEAEEGAPTLAGET